jgi:ABC-2 type transport system permease protein/lipopolysaccharide transport system permease protein
MTDLRVGAASFDSPYLALAFRTIKNLRTCLEWAWLDTLCHYRRSLIGPLWETINVLVMILGMTVVSSAVIGGSITDLIGSIGLGIVTWSWISALITEGATTFGRNAGLITGSNISIDCYVGRTVLKTLISFGHHFVLYFLGLVFYLVPLTWSSLLAVPGIILLLLNGYWVRAVLAFICARFRDVEQIIRNLLQLAFFITPIFWRPEAIAPGMRGIVHYNPLYLIDVIRSPLLGEIPPLQDYVDVVGTTAAGYAIAVLIYHRMRRRLAFLV